MGTKTADIGQEVRKPDSQGRIAIGKEHADEMYAINKKPNGDIVLTPVVVINKREAWLFNNPKALESVKEGLRESAARKTKSLGSFAQFADADDDEEE